MGQVHQLIATHGLEQARILSTDKVERQCIDVAYAVMSDEDNRIGVTHAGFAVTALPHKEIKDSLWTREGGTVKLIIQSGIDREAQPIGIPFGSIARMILLYLQTEAVKTKSRDIELGRSMNQWLGTMGIDNGGKTYKLVREQSKRLSMCRLSFFRTVGATTHVTNGSFVRDAIIPSSSSESNQLTLWREAVRLDEGFYQSLISHPMPVREAAIREISSRSMAIDIYIWLAYRLHHLTAPTPVSWNALFKQFGAGFEHSWHFKNKVRDPLSLALAAYPEAKVSIDSVGLTLYPSPPAVPERLMLQAVR